MVKKVWPDITDIEKQAAASGLKREPGVLLRHIYPYGYRSRSIKPFYVLPKFLTAKMLKEVHDYIKTQEATAEQVDGWLKVKSLDISPDVMPGLYERMTQAMLLANDHWQFAVSGWIEQIVTLRYERGDFNEWHTDYTETDRTKLGFTSLLNSPDEYTGGELQMLGANYPVLKSKGDVVIFPGYQAHRVSKVTKGTRLSLAGWVGGPEFR